MYFGRFFYFLDWFLRWTGLFNEMVSLEVIIYLGCCRGGIREFNRLGYGEGVN